MVEHYQTIGNQENMLTLTDDQKRDIKKVLDTLDEIVEEFGPDYVYKPKTVLDIDGAACVYVVDGKPSCLAGQVLFRLGVSVDDLAKNDHERGYVSIGATNPANGAEFEVPLDLSRFAFKVLRVAQTQQDMRYSWGKARDLARECAYEIGYVD